MNAFLNWLIGPKVPAGSVGVIEMRESNYVRVTNPSAKIPHQWIEPLREGEDGIVRKVEHPERPVYRNACERIRAEERAKAAKVEQEFLNQLQEVLS